MQQSLLKMRREDWHWQTLIAETLKDTGVTQFLCGAESELEPSPRVFYRKGPNGGRGELCGRHTAPRPGRGSRCDDLPLPTGQGMTIKVAKMEGG